MSTVGAADLSVDLRCHSAIKKATQTKVVDYIFLWMLVAESSKSPAALLTLRID